MTEAVWVQIITTLGLVVIAVIGNRKLNRIGGDAREAREQTANTHETNLRDDVDAIAELVRGQSRHLERIDRHLEDLHTEDESIEQTLGTRAGRLARALADQQAALADAIHRHEGDMARIPGIVAAAVHLAERQHINACPLRRGTSPTAGTPA